jgi:hypothetical protein
MPLRCALMSVLVIMILLSYETREGLGKTNRLISLIRHGPHRKRPLPNNSSIVDRVFIAAVTFLPSCCLATMGSPYIDTQTDGRNL